jgi:hypothetical protein
MSNDRVGKNSETAAFTPLRFPVLQFSPKFSSVDTI